MKKVKLSDTDMSFGKRVVLTLDPQIKQNVPIPLGALIFIRSGVFCK